MYLQFSKSYDLKYLKSAAIIIWLFAVKKCIFNEIEEIKRVTDK